MSSPFLSTIDFQRGKPLKINATTAATAQVIHAMTTEDDLDAAFLYAQNSDSTRAEINIVLNPDDSAAPADSETLTYFLEPYEGAWLINGLRFRKSTSVSNTYTVGAYAGSSDGGKVRICFYAQRQFQDEVTA